MFLRGLLLGRLLLGALHHEAPLLGGGHLGLKTVVLTATLSKGHLISL
jgi:hypothetical protein